MRTVSRAARPFVALGFLLAACSSPADPVASADDDAASAASMTGAAGTDERRAIRVGACSGPATALPPALVVESPQVTPDARWAALARRVPGGFAGVLYEGGRPILLLTDPSQAADAKAALASDLPGFDVARADVRQARWTFAQLDDWYLYLLRQPIWGVGSGVTVSDIDEQANRIYLGARDPAARDRLAARLAALELPCDLVLVGVTAPAVLAY